MAKRKRMGIDFGFFSSDTILKNIPFILFLGFLAVIYIANAHLAERNIRQIQESQRELKEMRWYFMTLQAENMYKIRRSEMAKSVKELGLQPISEKPKKIIAKKSE